MRLPLGYTARLGAMGVVCLVSISSLLAHNTLHDLWHRCIQLLLTQLDQLPTQIAHLAPCYGAQLLQSPLGFFSMPSQVGITLGIVQALYQKPITRARLNPTAFGQGITLINDLLV
jgi:hypothetical protein